MGQKGKESLLDKKVIEGVFTIISPVLDPDEEKEWLITDGDEVFPVIVHDEDFLQAVKEGKVSFTNGCQITCELEVTQWLTNEGVRSDYQVRQVAEVTQPEDP